MSDTIFTDDETAAALSPAISFPVEGTAMDAAMVQLTIRRGLWHERAGGWPTTVTALPDLGRLVASHRNPGATTHVIERGEGALRLVLRGGWVDVIAAAATLDELKELVSEVRREIPRRPIADPERQLAGVTFWALCGHQAQPTNRPLEVPSWPGIEGNYAAATRAALERLMKSELPLAGGRLILWHGAPGTGKTNALRALAWEWREQASVHYVTDPEALLGNPGYLQSVLLGPAPGPRDHWRLIVLEDAGELLAPDAKAATGQALARLLNLTDGLVGQGLKVAVLITGNEPLHRLHPAVARPGRCASEIEFTVLDAAAANEWLTEHGHEPDEPRAATLAELYARLEGRPAGTARGAVGFASA